MVQNSEWGPHLWEILHICAEKSGKQSTHILHMDEVRLWISFLKMTEAILPCPLCQKHYRKWLEEHSVTRFLDTSNPETFSNLIRKWLWSLHNAVNEQRQITALSFDEAMSLYKTKGAKDIQQALEKLLNVLNEAKLKRLIDGAFLREWKQILSRLRRFITV